VWDFGFYSEAFWLRSNTITIGANVEGHRRERERVKMMVMDISLSSAFHWNFSHRPTVGDIQYTTPIGFFVGNKTLTVKYDAY
jgi:hypothetical protein